MLSCFMRGGSERKDPADVNGLKKPLAGQAKMLESKTPQILTGGGVMLYCSWHSEIVNHCTGRRMRNTRHIWRARRKPLLMIQE